MKIPSGRIKKIDAHRSPQGPMTERKPGERELRFVEMECLAVCPFQCYVRFALVENKRRPMMLARPQQPQACRTGRSVCGLSVKPVRAPLICSI
jgi:hypothetical protein